MILLLSKKWKQIDKGKYVCTSQFKNHGEHSCALFNLLDLNESLFDFGMIEFDEENEFLITDRFNTVPIYFCRINNNTTVSDNIRFLLENSNFPFDKDSAVEHLLFDFTFTPFKTLYKGIYKVPAGSKVKVTSDGNFKVIEQLTNKVPDSSYFNTDKTFIEKTKEIKQHIIDYISSYDKYYIPVSGGLDSRIVLGIAAEYTNAEIYSRTYGDKYSLDVKNGQRVAKKLKIKHDVISKTDDLALAEFERTVLETGAELNGVHGHDIEGRDLFENGPWNAKISGFIGDLLARGANLKDTLKNKDDSLKNLINTRTNFNKYDYQKLVTGSAYSLNEVVSDYVDSLQNTYGNYNSLTWDYYVTKRVGCMTSLLESFTHISKPNLKPFIIPEVVDFIASAAANDKWDGMYYYKFASILIPDLLNIPLSSNSIFKSRFTMYKFKIEKRLVSKRNQIISRLSNGEILPLEHNATLNWSAILKRNPEWVNKYLSIASLNFGFNSKYIDCLYMEHCRGYVSHEEFLLRVISLGIIAGSK